MALINFHPISSVFFMLRDRLELSHSGCWCHSSLSTWRCWNGSRAWSLCSWCEGLLLSCFFCWVDNICKFLLAVLRELGAHICIVFHQHSNFLFLLLYTQGIVSDILYRASTGELESHTNTDGKVNVVSVVVVQYHIVHYVDGMMMRWKGERSESSRSSQIDMAYSW